MKRFRKTCSSSSSMIRESAPARLESPSRMGSLTLLGTVESYTQKWSAEEIALRVTGVKAVVNQLEVKLPSSAARTDEEIAKAAKQALESSWEIPASVKVSVEKGWITLHGDVEWHY